MKIAKSLVFSVVCFVGCANTRDHAADSLPSIDTASDIYLTTASPKADVDTTYSASKAVSYATANYAASYCSTPGCSTSGKNPWGNYETDGNCTNFVSQAIIAGMIGSSSMSTTYSKRKDFDIDATSSTYQWYWTADSTRGPAFTGADKLKEYADYNKTTYKGLHFSPITYDTSTAWMNVSLVNKGDVIFADWEDDGTFDHSMLVTSKGVCWSTSDYTCIKVTYQNAVGYSAKKNKPLSDINADYDYAAVFHVYRPIDYSPDGL